MKYLASSFVFCVITSNTFAAECSCDHTLASSVDGSELSILPGQSICIDGSQTYNTSFFWKNLVGTQENPITITNCNGVAHINPENSPYGWKFQSSEHIRILGNGDDEHTYGIKVTTRTGFFLTMEYFTNEFEIAHLEIAGANDDEEGNKGFAGIGLKTSPYVDCDLFQDETKTAFIMNNIKVHDNYIHDVGGEGIYAGHGFYNGRQESSCPENTITYAHNIHNLSIYNNLITDVGFDGIQVKNADSNALVYNNIIYNYGLQNEGAHNEGMLIGDGFEGSVYSNWIESGSGHGFQINAFGNTKIYNNIVIDSGGDGIYLNNRSGSFANRDGVFGIYHNTFINSGDDGIEGFLGDGQGIDVQNNIFVNFGDKSVSGISTNDTTNIFESDVDELGFIDANIGDYGLTDTSMARDLGIWTDINEDYTFTERTDASPDIGAYEYGSNSGSPLPADETAKTSNDSKSTGSLGAFSALISLLLIFGRTLSPALKNSKR